MADENLRNEQWRMSRRKESFLNAIVRGVGVMVFAAATLVNYEIGQMRTATYNQSLTREALIDEGAINRAIKKENMVVPLHMNLGCYSLMGVGAIMAIKRRYDN